jgi:hypothetical protein
MSRKVLIRNLEDARTEGSVFVSQLGAVPVEIKPGREAVVDAYSALTLDEKPLHPVAPKAKSAADDTAAQEAENATPVEPIWSSRQQFEAMALQELREIGEPHGINGRSKAGIIEEIVEWQENNATVAAAGPEA